MALAIRYASYSSIMLQSINFAMCLLLMSAIWNRCMRSCKRQMRRIVRSSCRVQSGSRANMREKPSLRHLNLGGNRKSYPHIPVVMHQDHGASPEMCASRAIQSGFQLGDDGWFFAMADMKTPSEFRHITPDVTRTVSRYGACLWRVRRRGNRVPGLTGDRHDG